MALFDLEYMGHAYGGAHLTCPHCDAKFDVSWSTEYGDASVGEHDAKCLKCEKPFRFSVWVEYSTCKLP